MKKFLARATVAVLIAAGAVGVTAAPALATYEECVPKDAWTETIIVTPEVPAKPAIPAVPAVPEVLEVSHFEFQRYSWTGGPVESAPTEIPPSANWQANTTNYDGAGHGTDPIGSAFQKDKPGKGNADWFFWTKTKVIYTPHKPGIPEVPGVPAVPAVPAVTRTVDHPAVTCGEEGSVVVPEKPEETVVVTETSETDCTTKTVSTTTTTTTSGRTAYNEETNAWDPIEDLVAVASSERPATETECPVTVTPSPTPDPKPSASASSTPVPAADVTASDLAETGGSNLAWLFWPIAGVLTLGAAFLIGSFIWRRKHPVTTESE